MESSESSLSSEWDVVSSTLLNSEELIEESPSEVAIKEWVNDVEKEHPPVGSSVDDLNEADIHNNNDSNSSSDIDVIEEIADDMIHSSISISPMEYSLSSSLDSGPLALPAPVAVPNVEEGWNSFMLTQRLLRNPQIKDYLIIIFISIAVASTMHLQGTPVEDKIKQMKEQVDELKKENTDLRNRVISKIEDNKLFITLEEQITALKKENIKLSTSLQSLITHLEEQTAIFKKENEVREKDPYKNEIDKLKEQVNILKIDNDELQRQLVRMRYGAYSPYSENIQEEKSGEEIKLDQNDDKNENSSDILTEEIENLKKKLYLEVNELKDWKESINHLIKKLNEKENKDFEKKDEFENKKPTKEEKSRKQEKFEKPNKEQQFYDWSWKDFQKNLRGTIDNIKVPDMFSKYVNGNRKKVEGVFESVGHYFKKAQEKAKKILQNNKNGQNDVWDFLGDLRKKWADMKNEFFETHHKNGPVPPNSNGNENKKDFTPDFDDEPPRIVNEKSAKWRKEMPRLPDLMRNDPEVKRIMNEPDWQHKLWAYYFKEVINAPIPFSNQQELENSWLFNRAAGRSVFREQDKQEGSTNWFLRKKKITTEDSEFAPDIIDVFEDEEEFDTLDDDKK